MSDLIPFTYGDRPVRVVTVDGEPWFVAADVAAILGYRMASDATRRVDAEDRGTHSTRTPGGEQQVSTVNESGLYTLILGSRLEAAKPFKRWVTSEVLPSIRKTGGYGTQRFEIPGTFAEALELAARQARELDAAKEHIAELAPSAAAWDTLADTGADYSAREAAYILNRDPAISTGQNRLMDLLREWRVIGLDNRPYANHAAHVTLRPRTRKDRVTGEKLPARPQVRITVAGLRYLHKRLGGSQPLDLSKDVA